MDGRCKDCQHWGHEGDPPYVEGENVHRPCGHDKLDLDDLGRKDIDGASCDWRESGGLFAGPLFGCVQFEPGE